MLVLQTKGRAWPEQTMGVGKGINILYVAKIIVYVAIGRKIELEIFYG